MVIKYFEIKRDYPIKHKSFFLENDVRIFILGVHGFAEDKESSILSELAKALSSEGVSVICFDFTTSADNSKCFT